MSISYPITMPTRPTRLTFTCDFMQAATKSPYTGQTQYQDYNGDEWLLDVTLPPLSEPQARPWIAFLMKLKGIKGSFIAGDTKMATPRGVASGTPLVNGANQTGDTLVTDGWTPNTTNILRECDYLQIGNRLYMVMTDTNSDSGGNATIDICPKIRDLPADNSPIVTTNCKGLFRLSTSSAGWSVNEDGTYTVSFSAIEPK